MVQLINTREVDLANLIRLLSVGESLCLEPNLWSEISGIKKQLSGFNSHVWLSSSGSSQKKLIGLSYNALNSSAASVNKWLDIRAHDRWALALPLNHIGGLSILIRSLQANFEVCHFREKWNPFNFCNFLAKHKCTICSLVPTQLFDLLCRELAAPPNLRAAIIGGARLTPEIYKKARELSWPVLPSYGMTERSSQIASASLASICSSAQYPTLEILPHLECVADNERVLLVKGPSLLSASVSLNPEEPPRLDQFNTGEYFKTQDLVKIDSSASIATLEIFGRADRQHKIKGWLVSLDEIESRIESFLTSRGLQILFSLGVRENQRDGKELILHVSKGSMAASWQGELNSYLVQESHTSIITQIIEHAAFPLLQSGKINRALLDAFDSY